MAEVYFDFKTASFPLVYTKPHTSIVPDVSLAQICAWTSGNSARTVMEKISGRETEPEMKELAGVSLPVEAAPLPRSEGNKRKADVEEDASDAKKHASKARKFDTNAKEVTAKLGASGDLSSGDQLATDALRREPRLDSRAAVALFDSSDYESNDPASKYFKDPNNRYTMEEREEGDEESGSEFDDPNDSQTMEEVDEEEDEEESEDEGEDGEGKYAPMPSLREA